LFLLEEDQPVSGPALQDDLLANPTIRMRVEDALYLHPEKLLSSLPLTTRIMRGLESVLKLSRSLQTSVDTRTILLKLCEFLFPVIPAERASVILLDGEDTESIHIWDSNLITLDSAVSRTVVLQVARERIAILSNDISSGKAPLSTASLIGAKVS